jgi:hypothetical protein
VSDQHEFVFALELSDEPHFDSMLADLAAAVLVHVGYQAPAIDELRAVLRKALAAGAPNGQHRCDVQFRAQNGELHIAVVFAGGTEWRTTRALP